jgi:amidase
MNSAVAWIVGYWIRRLGREPGPDDLDPLTRAYWESGRRIPAGDYLLAMEDLQRFARVVAGFLDRYDVFVTPTMSAPPPRLGASTAELADTVRYAGVVANITGNPAMSVPLAWTGDGLPLGVHVLGRYGGEATLFRLAAQLESARPWAARRPPVHASVQALA